jgi:hypothetical protein
VHGRAERGIMAKVGHDITSARRRARRLAAALVLAATALAAHAQQAREDAWWTGPMLAASGATLPQGHVLIEPYLYDVMITGRFDDAGKHHSVSPQHDLGSLTYWLYGVTDRVTLGAITRFGYNESAAISSSHVGSGDLTLHAAYGLSHFVDGRRTPDIAAVLELTLPSGRYDELGRASDGYGAGTYTTGLSVYCQDYLWMPNGRILRVRLDLTYAVSSSAQLHDASVYGTPPGFSGRAYPGDGFTVDVAGEYSLTRNWVLALDAVYQHNGSTRVTGTLAAPAEAVFQADSGSGYALALAPAIEFNWSAKVGVLLGVRVIGAGRNSTSSVTPAVAVNMVF